MSELSGSYKGAGGFAGAAAALISAVSLYGPHPLKFLARYLTQKTPQ